MKGITTQCAKCLCSGLVQNVAGHLVIGNVDVVGCLMAGTNIDVLRASVEDEIARHIWINSEVTRGT